VRYLCTSTLKTTEF